MYGTVNVLGRHFGYTQIDSRRGERTVQITVTDLSGLPVAFDVAQWTSKRTYDLGSYCSKTPTIRVPR